MAPKNVIANFTFDGGKAPYEVIECGFGFTQNYDASNKPSGFPSINIINLVVKTTAETELVDWMLTPTAEKDGLIKIKLNDNTYREISFSRGYCVQYNERFDNYSGSSYSISIGILVKDISVNDRDYTTEWDNN